MKSHTGMCRCGTILVQGTAKRRFPGLVNFVATVAYRLCLALPAAFTQPGVHLLAGPCTTPWQFGSCGSISPAKIFEIALGREFEPRLGKFLELARIYHKHSPHKPNCHGVSDKCIFRKHDNLNLTLFSTRKLPAWQKQESNGPIDSRALVFDIL